MPKIKSIQLHNYKFFNEQEPINLEVDGECKHLLLYGENGSGKSSIFWGLHTLFESSLKEDEDIQKYFKHRDESAESLVNIYAEKGVRDGIDDYNSFIEVITNEELNNAYRVSLFDLDINQNENAQLINQTSEFLSYKDLFEFQRFWNGRPMNLAQIFISSVLPFLEFPESELIKGGEKVKITNAFQKWWEIRHVGPGTTKNEKKKIIQVYKTSKENQAFNKFVKEFNENIKDLIDFINVNAPLIIKQLGYDINFELKYNEPYYKKGYTQYECENFEIEFLVTSYLGEPIKIYRPQSFLNEAKISAIALAIKLSVLKRKFNNRIEIPKFIVFDDLMISLDMNNRDRLTDYILNPENDLISKYQVFILTHDRSLFYFLKDKIKNIGKSKEWIYKEVYVNEEANKQSPSIYDFPNKIKKAKYYLQIHDYPACGIYLRTFCEEVLNNLYPDTKKYEIKTNDQGLNETRELNLNSKINHLESFCKEEDINYENFKDLKTYKSVILNSLAHNDIHSPLYKVELEKVLDVLEKLNQYKRVEFIKPNSSFTIDFTKPDGSLYTIGIKTKDNLYLIEKENDFVRLSNICKANITYINDNAVETKGIEIEKNSIKEIVYETCESLGIENDMILEDSLKYRNETIVRELINNI
jgi:energy-coupling factor transporter ATP-binding protein EcfA2